MTTPESGPLTSQLSENARLVLERRYLARDDRGRPLETPEQLFARVAHNIAQAEVIYAPDDKDAAARWEVRFLELMTALDFLPNSPTLMNAGRELQQLPACLVLPGEGRIDGLFPTISDHAQTHRSG